MVKILMAINSLERAFESKLLNQKVRKVGIIHILLHVDRDLS
jgi:hypothetical protein